MNYSEEIKGRLSVEQLVGQYVQLKKAGVNFKGLCPFHSEGTPSFVVSPEKQIWHCFGCNKGGDIFTFIQEIEGVEFPEALKLLADKVGIEIKQDEKFSGADKSEKEELFLAHEIACEYFRKQLFETKDGEKVLSYLQNRGVKEGDIKEFQLGFAPDSYDGLYPLLLKKGIKRDVILKSGLAASKGTDGAKIYDKYRARLIFPIFDYLGRVCGFGGRALKKDQMPKYLNSPENAIYNKSKVLYGLSHAKQAIKAKDRVLLVEGYFDVILPYQIGVEETVATSGTALTADQVKLISRLTKNVVSCFDKDNAGFEATKRAYFLLKKAGINLKVVGALGEKDPADYVREHGHDFEAKLAEAQHFVSFYIARLCSSFDPESLDGRRVILDELLPILKTMGETDKDYFVRELSVKAKISAAQLYDEILNFKLPAHHPARAEVGAETGEAVKMKFSELHYILSILLERRKLFKNDLDFLFSGGNFANEKAIYNALADQYNSLGEEMESWNFALAEFSEFKRTIEVLSLFFSKQYSHLNEYEMEGELSSLIERVRERRVKEEIREISDKLSAVRKSGDKEAYRALQEKFSQLVSSKK